MPLSIHADLSFRADDGTEIRVEAEGGSQLCVRIPDWRTAFPLWRQREPLLMFLRPFEQRNVPVDVEIYVKSRRVARMGANTSPGWLERALRLHPFELKLFR